MISASPEAYRRAADLLLSAQRVAVIGHMRPDADAVGSVASLTMALRQKGITVTPMVGQEHPFSENLLSIPGAQDIQLGGKIPEVDLVVAVDCGSLDRTGVLADQVANSDSLLVIDHHASNPRFGTHNLVDEKESTTMVLRELFRLLNTELYPELAHALYAGLVTDTGSFRWGTARMHEMAAELMAFDLDIREIADVLLDRISAHDLAMIGRVLAGMKRYQVDQISVAVLSASRQDVQDHSASAVERLIDFARSVDGADIGAVFKGLDEETWAVSLRSTSVNVAEVATCLGGGGHVAAAGYTTYAADPEAELIDAIGQLQNPRGQE